MTHLTLKAMPETRFRAEGGGEAVKGKKYLITGITGFAGPHLAKLLLKEGHNVYGLIRGSNGRENDLLDILTPEELGQIKWLYGDLVDYLSLQKIFEEIQFDGVFHLAAQSHPPTSFKNPVLTFQDNIIGSANLIEAIGFYQAYCRLMFCSTSEVYGDACKDVGVLSEDLPLTPSNPYGVSKAAIDLYMQERCKNGYIDGFITRAFSHTGPRRGHTFSISCDAYNLIRMYLDPKLPRKLQVGNLSTRRIVVDVRDMVRAYYLLMEKHENGGVYNICGPQDSVQEMGFFTDKLIELSGLHGVTKERNMNYYRKEDIQVQIGSTEKLKNTIDWTPEIPIERTLQDLLNYWLEKLHRRRKAVDVKA
jgi:GDP-4-dehydro-6-deoxy-D-mannose reductase